MINPTDGSFILHGVYQTMHYVGLGIVKKKIIDPYGAWYDKEYKEQEIVPFVVARISQAHHVTPTHDL